MGVLRRSTWILAVAACTGCLQANDRVLQPDESDKPSTQTNMQGASGGGGTSSPAEPAAGGSGTAGKPASSAAASGGSAMSMGGSSSSAKPDAGGTNPLSNKAGSGGTMAPVDASMGVSTGGSGGGSGSSDAGMDAGMASSGEGAADPECDFHGIWIAKQMTVSEALSLPQTSNNWYYLELKQIGNAVEISKHFDCGIEVRGSATVVLSKATLEASTKHNLQAGRKIKVEHTGATCSFDAARYWSIRGADELRFLPGMPNPDRDFPDNIADVAKVNPLPTAQKTDGAIDTEMDGKLGIAFQVTGIIMGTRNSVQRDWTRWFTDTGYEIMASQDWSSDLTIRADFDNEESILDPTSGLLVSNSAPKAGAKHALKLHFLGRDASDPRVAQIVKDSDVDTCYAIQDAMPAETLE